MKNAAFFLETNTVRKTTIYLIYADAIMTQFYTIFAVLIMSITKDFVTNAGT